MALPGPLGKYKIADFFGPGPGPARAPALGPWALGPIGPWMEDDGFLGPCPMGPLALYLGVPGPFISVVPPVFIFPYRGTK